MPSMNWYHRGEERYVEYGSSFAATRRSGCSARCTDTVYNMNLAHLTPGASGRCSRPRRRRPAHGGHHLPDVPRPPPPRALAATRPTAGWPGGAVPARRVGPARAVLRGPVRHRARPAARRRSACPGQRDRHAGCVGAHWWRTTCSTSCSSRCPTTTPTRTGGGPTRRSCRSPRRTGRSAADGRRRRPRRVPRRARRDRDVGPLAEPGRAATNLAEALPAAVLRPVRPGPRERGDRGLPGARSAQVYVLDPDRREALARARGRGAGGGGGRRHGRAARDGEEGVVGPRAASCASRPGGDRDRRRAAARWSVTGDLEALDLTRGRRRCAAATIRTRCGACGRRSSATRTGDVLLSAEPGYEFIDWGGAAHMGGGSHGSLHRCDSLGVLLTSAWARPAPGGATSGRSRT